jgi:hypothetical protein
VSIFWYVVEIDNEGIVRNIQDIRMAFWTSDNSTIKPPKIAKAINDL